MKPVITLMLFIGMFMIVAGVYEQKYQKLDKLVRTEYKFIPRSMYEDALATPDLVATYSSHFDVSDPWFNRTAEDTDGRTWYYRQSQDIGTHLANTLGEQKKK
jgi:hypothetical protein